MRGDEVARSLSGKVRRLGPLLSVLSMVALAAIVLRTDVSEMVRAVADARVELVAAAILLALFVEILKAVRWLLLINFRASALPRLLGLIFTSRILNALAPVRAGDVWRVADVAKSDGGSVALAAASILAEKLMDGAALAAVGVLLLGTAVPSSMALAVLLAGLAALVLLALGLPAKLAALSDRYALGSRLSAAGHLKEGRRLVAATGLTVAAIGAGLAVNLVVLEALRLPPSLLLGAAMLVSAYAAGLLPATPGQIGVFELSVSGALMATGLAPSSAVAAALGLHLVLLATLAIGGVLSLPLGHAQPRMIGGILTGAAARSEMESPARDQADSL